MENQIRPTYYQDAAGHDLFWRMEHNQYPAALSMGFCVLNIQKYRDRAGVKTPDAKEDLRKADTYQQELDQLTALYNRGKITNQGLEQYLHNTHWERQMIAAGIDRQRNVIPYPQQLTKEFMGVFFARALPDLFLSPGEEDDQLNVLSGGEVVATVHFDRRGHYRGLVATQARFHLDNQPYGQLIKLHQVLEDHRRSYDELLKISLGG